MTRTCNIAPWDRALRVFFGAAAILVAPGWWKLAGVSALVSAAWNH